MGELDRSRSEPDCRVLNQFFLPALFTVIVQLEKTQDLQAVHLLFCLSAAFPRNTASTRLFPTFRPLENGQWNVFPSTHALGKTGERNLAPAGQRRTFSWDMIGVTSLAGHNHQLDCENLIVCASFLPSGCTLQPGLWIHLLAVFCWAEVCF